MRMPWPRERGGWSQYGSRVWASRATRGCLRCRSTCKWCSLAVSCCCAAAIPRAARPRCRCPRPTCPGACCMRCRAWTNRWMLPRTWAVECIRPPARKSARAPAFAGREEARGAPGLLSGCGVAGADANDVLLRGAHCRAIAPSALSMASMASVPPVDRPYIAANRSSYLFPFLSFSFFYTQQEWRR